MITSSNNSIDTLELFDEGIPSNFVYATMEEIDKEVGGIADDPHRHNYYTVIWPVNATGSHLIDFKEYRIENNAIFFVSPQQIHQVITGPSPIGHVILFTPEFLNKNSIKEDFISNLKLFKKADETPPLPVSAEKACRLSLFVNEIAQAYNSDSPMKLEVIGSYLKLFLIECNNLCTLPENYNTQRAEVEKSLVKSFKDLLEKRFKDLHQVKDYANLLNISPNYLNEVIKTSINVSAKELIQERIILEAKRILLFSNKSLKETGFDLGFEDPSHFSKFFKGYAGVSAQEFRNLSGKEQKL